MQLQVNIKMEKTYIISATTKRTGINTQWHFFGSAYGKSACDGAGGITKCEVANASLQNPHNDQILCNEHLRGIKSNISKLQQKNSPAFQTSMELIWCFQRIIGTGSSKYTPFTKGITRRHFTSKSDKFYDSSCVQNCISFTFRKGLSCLYI